MSRLFNILIAEDEALERKVLRHLLERGSLPVRTIMEASSGREALQMALERRPDIIVLDIKMPGLDGLEAARLIRAQLPQSAIIILTAYDRFNYSQKAIKIGAADFLLKPVQPEELYQSLRAVMERLEGSPDEQSLPPGNMPAVPPGVRDIAEHIISGNPGQSAAAWELLVDTWLKSLPDRPEKAYIGWFAWEVLVIVCQDLQGKSLPAGEISRIRSQGHRIRALASVQDLRQWGLQMVEEIDSLHRKYISLDQMVIYRVQRYIKENYPQEISLNLLADLVHLNQAYLSRLFKQKAGLSFTDYLARVRLQEAKRLLVTTDQTIDEIAYAVGFKNNSYFTSVFKKREGINPSEFRSRHFTK